MIEPARKGDCAVALALDGAIRPAGVTDTVEQNHGVDAGVAERLAARRVTAPMALRPGGELHVLERKDPEGGKTPRSKPHVDVLAILRRLRPAGLKS